ncbi:MAG TPA: hypothetical protein VHC70_02675 [Phycisphaerales bacterium]|nr:hypothetical protein [Phycisphaerales bacterium]
MLFIHPMWDNESQRIGKQKCTPFGYALHASADLIGFLGLILLLVTFGVWIWKWMHGTFHTSTLWLLTIPLGVGTVSEVLYHLSWWLAVRRGWLYDWERREASWMENGTRITFKYERPPPVQ